MPTNDAEPTPGRKPRVQSAARAIAILQAVARHGAGGVSARDISAELGLPRQVVYHLVHTLAATDMLRRASGSRYVLGLGVAALALGFRRQLMAPDFLGQYVHEAAAVTGETAYAVGWVDGRIVVLATARGALPVHAAEIPHGYADDAHARASGKLLLAMAPPAEADAYLDRHPPTPRTPRTLTTRAALREEFARIRGRRYAIEREEFVPGLACVAVPIGPEPSALVLGISAPVQRFDEHRDSYIAGLQAVARGASSGQ